MPRLKVGDTFTYTKEMNEVKLKSNWSDDAAILIGKEVEVWGVYTGAGYYVVNLVGLKTTGHVCAFDCIDDYLPATEPTKPPKKPKRTWDSTKTSSDGIVVTKEAITIDGQVYEAAALKTHISKCRAALEVWENL